MVDRTPHAAQDGTPGFDTARISAQVRKWQERLLDLTKANPLLGLNRSRVSKLRVAKPDAAALFDRFVVAENQLRMPLVRKRPKLRSNSQALAIATPDAEASNLGVARVLNPLLDEEPSDDDFIVEPGDVIFEAKPADLLRRLRRIYDNARTTIEERGVTTLHLTFGTIVWDEPALGESRSPIWMVPCQFEYAGPNAALRLQLADEEMQLNPALELYLRERQHVTLPAIPEVPVAGDLARYLDAVLGAVREQGWTVDDSVSLSTFSFESLGIYQDLRILGEVAAKNPIVAALARAGASAEGSESLGEDLDDLPTPDRVPVPVLAADASQLGALTLAAAGRNLVIHGPPGTGKSQTISNLIADALGRRQTVLFVSAKMAALNVVHDRLAEKGLARFCLEAHSTKAGKAKIIEELKRTLETTRTGDDGLFEEQLEELRRVRGQLNDYVRQLHERREPLGLSVYQAIGKVAKQQAVPSVGLHVLPWENPLAVSRSDLRAALDLLEELAAQGSVFDGRDAHPWRGFTVTEDHRIREETVESALTTALNAAQSLLANLRTLATVLGPGVTALSIQGLRTLGPALVELEHCERLPAQWHNRAIEDVRDSAEVLEQAAENAKQFMDRRAEYERSVALSAAECVALLQAVTREFGGWTRVMQPRYWRWRSSVRERLQPGAAADLAALRSYLNLARDLVSAEEWFRSHDSVLLELVGPGNRDPGSLSRAATEYRAAGLLRTACKELGLTASHQEAIAADVRTAANALSRATKETTLAEAEAYLDVTCPGGFVTGGTVAAAPLPSLAARCEEALTGFTKLHEWMLLQHTLRRSEVAGLGRFIDSLGSTSARFAPAAFERRFHTSWINRVIEHSPALGLFASERRAERVERFRQLDERVRELALNRIKAIAADPARSISTAQSNLGDGGEVGILRRELQKRKRIKPLRKLFAEIPHALQALKPCMLMSPLSVSTFLKPGGVSFDLVVFDEASQLPTPEAIPAILRARQVIVAGDEKQLPPSSFFEASVIFDEDGIDADAQEELEPLQSLLDNCVAIVPMFRPAFLAWHYRSRDERLINFSNHYFYHNTLVTFPSATTSSEGRGVHHVYVPDGVWDRGRSRTNRREARRVAEVVIEQLARYPDRSLGVVAMNATQREAIELTLSELIEQRPDVAPLLSPARPEPFFIKALENVQGDERDTMVISVGYAKTDSGALSLNFGPLNRDGGERRLNVLVTRAKWQTILVTSMQSQELTAVSPNNRGAFMLRKFIEYAESGGTLPRDPATLSRAETNDFEEAVAEALRQCEVEVDEQVGVAGYRIDLAIRDPRDRSRYLLGVECDGASYHSARTARDRDLLRQQVLRNQGWRLHRIWSTEWFRDRDKALQGVLRSIETALQAPAGESPEAPPTSSPQPTHQPELGIPTGSTDGPTSTKNRRFEPGRPYQKYRPVRLRDSDGIMDPRRVSELATQIADVVKSESPIHEEVLLDRLKEIYDVARAKSRIQGNVRDATRIAVRRHGVRHDSTRRFLYGGTQPVNSFRIPAEGAARSIGQIPPEEIEQAVLFIVEDQFGFPREHLPRAVAEVFELGRVNTGVTETVGDVVDKLVEGGRLRLSGPNVYLH